MAQPLVIILAVGLTKRLLPSAPRLSALADSGWCISMTEVQPAVTCTAQATLLTGKTPEQHGVVANGWHFRDTDEVRFWQQSNRLIQAEPFYVTARKQAKQAGRSFTCAKLFWWFNQGAAVDYSVTPKPHYGLAGGKSFDIHGQPAQLLDHLRRELGPFPFPAFWGPMAGIKSTQWIAQSAVHVIKNHQPDLTLVYLPHLDYDLQTFTHEVTITHRCVSELDDACAPLLDAAKSTGARVWVVSEYGHCEVSRAVEPNRVLRKAGLLAVRGGPFGEQLDLPNCRAFAVCDHQMAHVSVNDPADVARVRDLLAPLPGVARVCVGEERRDIHLDHPRSGEIILLSEPDSWFAYPFWLDDRHAPDYARSVAIHHKPGYDPCELLFDPGLRWPKIRVARRLAQIKLGFRGTLDVVPLNAALIHGSHGLPAADPLDQPIFIGDGPAPSGETMPMTAFAAKVLEALE